MEQPARFVQRISSAMKWVWRLAKSVLQTALRRKVPRNWLTANAILAISTTARVHATSTMPCKRAIAFSAANCTCSATPLESVLPARCRRLPTLACSQARKKPAGVSLPLSWNVVLAVTSAAWGTVGHSVLLVQLDSGPNQEDAGDLVKMCLFFPLDVQVLDRVYGTSCCGHPVNYSIL